MRTPKVTDVLEYFGNGEPGPKPGAILVTAVGAGGVVKGHVFAAAPTAHFRDCVRHWSDPVLKANPEVRRIEGCYRFPDENPANQPETAVPVTPPAASQKKSATIAQ